MPGLSGRFGAIYQTVCQGKSVRMSHPGARLLSILGEHRGTPQGRIVNWVVRLDGLRGLAFLPVLPEAYSPSAGAVVCISCARHPSQEYLQERRTTLPGGAFHLPTMLGVSIGSGHGAQGEQSRMWRGCLVAFQQGQRVGQAGF